MLVSYCSTVLGDLRSTAKKRRIVAWELKRGEGRLLIKGAEQTPHGVGGIRWCERQAYQQLEEKVNSKVLSFWLLEGGTLPSSRTPRP